MKTSSLLLYTDVKRFCHRENIVFGMEVLSLLCMLFGMICQNGMETRIRYLSNEILDVFGMLLIMILTYSIQQASHAVETIQIQNLLFCQLLEVVALGLFVDFLCWQVEGIPNLASWNLWVNTMYYMINSLMSYIYWDYAKESVHIEQENLKHRLSKVSAITVMVSELMIVSNVFFGFYFIVNENGVYLHGGGYWISIIPNFILAVATFLVIQKSTEKKRHKNILCFYLAVPLFVATLQMFSYDLYVLHPLCACQVTLIYNEIQSKRILEMDEMRMRIIQSQMQPHFLCNSLATMRGMIRFDPDEAVEMVDRFTGYLRGSLDMYSVSDRVALSQELALVRDYLEIERYRFGDKIQYEIENNGLEFLLPPLIVQPLVENAVCHGIRKRADAQGTVWIWVREDAHNYWIEIKDDGVGFNPEQKLEDGTSHIGLLNTKRRIERLTGGNMVVASEKGRGTTILISIPK